jgi:hypothetical protein
LRLQSSDIKTNNAKPSHKNIEDKKKLKVWSRSHINYTLKDNNPTKTMFGFCWRHLLILKKFSPIMIFTFQSFDYYLDHVNELATTLVKTIKNIWLDQTHKIL